MISHRLLIVYIPTTLLILEIFLVIIFAQEDFRQDEQDKSPDKNPVNPVKENEIFDKNYLLNS
jgi:hypothetical protein